LSGDPCSHQATRSYWIYPAIHSSSRKLPLQIRGKPLLLRRTIQFGLKSSRRRRTSGARSFAATGYYVPWGGYFLGSVRSPGLNVSTGRVPD
jgi:hypothetical protein